MYAYDFCRAVARHIDRRMGMKLASGLVEAKRGALLRCQIESHHLIAAGQRLMRIFAPELEIRCDDLPHGARPMARLIIYAVFEEEQPEPEIFVREPIMQRSLTVALRLFLEELVRTASTEAARPKPAAVLLPPHVEREVARLMRLPRQAIAAKA